MKKTSSPAVFTILINLLLLEDCLTINQFQGNSCICTMEYDPVCGADGKTYGNRCELTCRGVRWVKDGECKQSSSKQGPVPLTITGPGTPRATKHGSEKDPFIIEQRIDPGAPLATKQGSEKDPFIIEHKIDTGTKSKATPENEEYGVEYKFDPGTKPGAEKGEIGVKTFGPPLQQGPTPHI